MEREITVQGVTVTVTYNVIGRNRPATRYEPPEYAEAEVMAIFIGDEEVTDIVSDAFTKKVDDHVHSHLSEWEREDRYEAQADAAEFRRDMEREERMFAGFPSIRKEAA